MNATENLLKCFRGELIKEATVDAAEWKDAFVNAWLTGYDKARAEEAKDEWCDADTLITLVNTQTRESEVLSVTLHTVDVMRMNDKVILTIATQYTQRHITIDTAHTEIYSKSKYYER